LSSRKEITMSPLKSSTKRALMLSVMASAALLAAPALQAQTFPTKPVTFVVPFPPGGGPDVAARLIGEKLSARLGQPVVVDNKPGAGALIGAAFVAKAPADGHTLLFTPNTMAISPHVLAPGAGGGIDVNKDLTPVIAPAATPLILVANPSLGVKDLKGLVELAKKQPGLPYGSPGNGSPMHFAAEMMKKSAGVDLLHVPYKGVGPSITAALSGEVKLLFTGVGGALQHIRAGKLVPLAVVEKERSELLPNVPTATEQGVANVEVGAWYGVFTANGTPPAVVQRLNQEINAIVKLPDVKEKLLNAGVEPLGGTPKLLADFMHADNERYGQLAKQLNIKAD
jgi:tripartite-type tricarboxylate transporter receptor subunit TctC